MAEKSYDWLTLKPNGRIIIEKRWRSQNSNLTKDARDKKIKQWKQGKTPLKISAKDNAMAKFKITASEKKMVLKRRKVTAAKANVISMDYGIYYVPSKKNVVAKIDDMTMEIFEEGPGGKTDINDPDIKISFDQEDMLDEWKKISKLVAKHGTLYALMEYEATFAYMVNVKPKRVGKINDLRDLQPLALTIKQPGFYIFALDH